MNRALFASLTALTLCSLPSWAAAQSGGSLVQPNPQYSTQPQPTQPQTAQPAQPYGNTGGASYGGYGTEQRLNKAETADSGRSFELAYAHVDAGVQYAALTALAGGDRAGLLDSTGFGPSFGVGAGMRLFHWSFGVRGRFGMLSSFNLWQANAVVGLHTQIGNLDLGGELYGGFSAAQGFDAVSAAGGASSSPRAALGGNVGLGLGADYYFNRYVSLGAHAGVETLLLSRGGEQGAALAALERSAFLGGLSFGGGLRLGFHFGL